MVDGRHISATFGQLWARCWSQLAKVWPSLANICPSLIEVGESWSKLGGFDQQRQSLDEDKAKHGQAWPERADIGPKLDSRSNNWTIVGPAVWAVVEPAGFARVVFRVVWRATFRQLSGHDLCHHRLPGAAGITAAPRSISAPDVPSWSTSAQILPQGRPSLERHRLAPATVGRNQVVETRPRWPECSRLRPKLGQTYEEPIEVGHVRSGLGQI